MEANFNYNQSLEVTALAGPIRFAHTSRISRAAAHP